MKKCISCLLLLALLLTGCAEMAAPAHTSPTVVTTVTMGPDDPVDPDYLIDPTVSSQTTGASAPAQTVPSQPTEPATEPVAAGSAMVRVYPNGDSFAALAASWWPQEEDGLPMKQVRSAQELEALLEALGYAPLTQATQCYDEAFFAIHDLILIPLSATSGMTRYDEQTTVQGDQVVIQVTPRAQEPDTAVTQDMMDAFLLLGVAKADTKDRTVVVTGHTGIRRPDNLVSQ